LAGEVAEYFGISDRNALFHLRQAVSSGQILVCKNPTSKTIRDSRGKLKRIAGFVYVLPNNLAVARAKLSLKHADHRGATQKSRISNLGLNVSRERSPEAACESSHEEDLSAVPPGDADHDAAGGFRGKLSNLTRFVSTGAKVATGSRSKNSDPRFPAKSERVPRPIRTLSQSAKIGLLQTLLKEPLPFLHLHALFGLSKQSMNTLLDAGLLKETWGKRGIGKRLMLTAKGRSYLEQLRKTRKHLLAPKGKRLMRLKHKV
jgi:hypothetical protein